MPRLILMRHAKSSWNNAHHSDHERPLNKRGRLAASLMGRWLREEKLLPDLAFVSSAIRTQETWEEMALPGEMQTKAALYEADCATALQIIQSAGAAKTLLILGHQPTMQELANRLLEDDFVADYPTAKITVIDFDAPDWASVNFGAGRLAAEAAPKDLV